MPAPYTAILALVLTLTSLNARGDETDPPADPGVPSIQMQNLDRFIGRWVEVTRFTPADPPDAEPAYFYGTWTAKRAIGGHFLQMDGASDLGNRKIVYRWMYNVADEPNTFNVSYANSFNESSQMRCVWDEKTQTLSTTDSNPGDGEPRGFSSARFVNDTRIEHKGKSTTPDGELLHEWTTVSYRVPADADRHRREARRRLLAQIERMTKELHKGKASAIVEAMPPDLLSSSERQKALDEISKNADVIATFKEVEYGEVGRIEFDGDHAAAIVPIQMPIYLNGEQIASTKAHLIAVSPLAGLDWYFLSGNISGRIYMQVGYPALFKALIQDLPEQQNFKLDGTPLP